MTYRGIFLADGRSDLPLAGHIEAICADIGADVSLTRANADLIPSGVGKTVEARLTFFLRQGARPDIVFVHRDAEGEEPDKRRREVSSGAGRAALACPVAAVVPVRMTEAWLLLDEDAIRHVAGKPRGRAPLDLPPSNRVEALPDPKAKLAEVLLAASEATGRKRDSVRRDFGKNRELLRQRLEPSGPVSELPAWRRFRADAVAALQTLAGVGLSG